MTKSETQKQVRTFCRQHGVTVNGGQGIPLLGKAGWFHCADDWPSALAFLVRVRNEKIDHGKAYPWA